MSSNISEAKCFETPPAMTESGFSSSEVTALTGITARQLQWWDERRIVVPARKGRLRVYSAEDLIDILVIEELRRRRISLQQVRRVLRFLAKEIHARFADLVQDGRDHHLLLDGRRIYLRSESDQVVDLMRSVKQPMLLVCLTDAVRRLRIDLSDILARRGERKPAAFSHRSERRSAKPPATA
uniref:MerR family transcriptional regulator n=2 Tax=Paracidobacterium acidisoli TaxID=2303751 RepID=A0A372IKC4_9BACT